jgi:F0F1-type ATP synthase assembly protein I
MPIMDQKQWEERLDRAADRVSRAVTEGVHVLEDAYEKGKETIKEEFDGRRSATDNTASDASTQSAFTAGPKPATKGSPRVGLILVGLGIVWLLNTLGILDQPVFPILLIVLGVYFIARSK